MKRALFIVDPQMDFMPGGSLAVPFGDKIVPVINSLIPKFEIVVVSRDWHPADHKSFTTENPDKSVLDFVQVDGKDMIVWPPHCVQNTDGAKFHPDLNLDKILVFTKGTNPKYHPFSAWGGMSDVIERTAGQFFNDLGVGSVFVVGLAGDYCVKETAIDSSKFFKTYFIVDATRFIGEMNPTLEELASKEVMVINSSDLDIFLSDEDFHTEKERLQYPYSTKF
jgi:nicotinamidase/pyrazinamidase